MSQLVEMDRDLNVLYNANRDVLDLYVNNLKQVY